VRFALIIMGSGGRREGFLHPDQDNGLVIEPYPDPDHATVDPYFIALSERLTHAFDRAGFPLCTGNVMATNPVWRKTLPQWVSQIEGWALRRSPQAVLSSDIFLDFRPIFGAVEFGHALRREVLRIAAAYPAFIRQICWQQASEGGPIRLFGGIQAGSREGRTIDLKLHGTLPLVGMVRFLALRHGIAATGTLDRLGALAEAGQISASFRADLTDDFAALTAFRLRQQVSDMQAGKPIGNRLAPKRLTERERARLVQVFRTIDALRKSAAREFGGQAG
jgi:CBS domain-containing protein